MRRVRYHPAARDEFLREVRYYTDISRRLGERFDKEVQAAEARAAESPDVGSVYLQGARRILPRHFPFSLVYLTGDDEIFIIAIAPFRRKPGYWRGRT